MAAKSLYLPAGAGAVVGYFEKRFNQVTTFENVDVSSAVRKAVLKIITIIIQSHPGIFSVKFMGINLSGRAEVFIKRGLVVPGPDRQTDFFAVDVERNIPSFHFAFLSAICKLCCLHI
jgi:hypothetical protein